MKHNVLTITLNPSVDILYRMDHFKTGEVQRSQSTLKTAGGKGLNVSNVLNILGVNVTAAGFLGGANGAYIKEKLNETGIHHDFTEVPIDTRNCINILSNGVHTEILEDSETVPESYSTQLLKQVSKYNDIDFAVISGSLVKGIPVSIYADIIKLFNCRNIKVIVDVNAEILNTILKENVEIFLIKPNQQEAEAIEMNSIVPGGVENMVVSVGDKGLEYYSRCAQKKVIVPKVDVKNTVGSGDAAVAGFIYGYLNGSMDDALKSMAAAGTANAMEVQTGCINKSNYNEVIRKVSVEPL